MTLYRSSIYGDALEAFIGAVYLDKGFSFVKKFIIKSILTYHLDIEVVVATNSNYKSQIIEWSQKENKSIQFDTFEENGSHGKEFTCEIYVEKTFVSEGKGHSKKRAEQAAAMKACEVLNLK